MNLPDQDAALQQLYEDFPYPRRNPQDELNRLRWTQADYLDRINHYGWGGARDLNKPIRALVAGGGTGDATIFLAHQLARSGGTVVHLEISPSSMAVAQQRAAIRGLDNIRWISDPIESLPESGLESFEYINCMGVLHHLADPAAGLQALTKVLNPDGALAIGVYGYYGRAAIRYTRRILQRLGAYQADRQSQLEITYRLLDQLRPLHPMKKSFDPQFFDMLRQDPTELQDLLLNPRERSYTVGQLYDEIENSGLHLNSFTGFFVSGAPFKASYEHKNYLGDPDLLKLTDGKTQRESAELAELLHGGLTLRSVYASSRSNSVANLSDRERVPFFFFRPRHSVEEMLNSSSPGSRVTFRDQDGSSISMELQPAVREILLAIDGQRTVAEICDLVTNSPCVAGHPNRADYVQMMFASVFDRLNAFDWVLLGSGSGPWFPHAIGSFDRISS